MPLAVPGETGIEGTCFGAHMETHRAEINNIQTVMKYLLDGTVWGAAASQRSEFEVQLGYPLHRLLGVGYAASLICLHPQHEI